MRVKVLYSYFFSPLLKTCPRFLNVFSRKIRKNYCPRSVVSPAKLAYFDGDSNVWDDGLSVTLTTATPCLLLEPKVYKENQVNPAKRM